MRLRVVLGLERPRGELLQAGGLEVSKTPCGSDFLRFFDLIRWGGHCQVEATAARVAGWLNDLVRCPRYRFPPAIISHAVWLYYRVRCISPVTLRGPSSRRRP